MGAFDEDAGAIIYSKYNLEFGQNTFLTSLRIRISDIEIISISIWVATVRTLGVRVPKCIGQGGKQCDQIGRFMGLWATF